MADPETTQPNPALQKAETDAKAIGNWLLNWSHTHTVATAAILGILFGWLAPKIVGWFL